jgi:Fic family protein
LIAFMLHHAAVLSQPLLYLSLYFKQHRSEYYRLLDLVRLEGDWEAWLDFFLEGVERTASSEVQTARRLVALFAEDEAKLQDLGRAASTTLRVFHLLCERPLLTLNEVHLRANLSFATAAKAMDRLSAAGIVNELTGRQRNRVFAYDRYLAILNEGTEPL